MATVAVFDTNADNMQVMTPNAMITRYVDLATPGKESTAKASRRESDRGRGGKEESECLPGLLEPLLLGRECLLTQAPEGFPSQQGGADVSPFGEVRPVCG